MKKYWQNIFRGDSQSSGFALMEVIVAMVIMAIVGLLAWRGMDAMIRGREVIERRSNEDASYTQLIRQFDRDCQEILRRDELNISVSTSTSGSNSQPVVNANLGGGAFPAIVAGAKNIWWLRHYRADTQDAWLLVGYGMGSNGLQRWTSQPLFRRGDALNLWSGIVRDPDLLSSDLSVSWQAPTIVRQSFSVQNSMINGAGGSGISASGTASVPNNSTANNASTSAAVSVITPDQQGLVMQWWLKDIPLPLTRSCLMGGAL